MAEINWSQTNVGVNQSSTTSQVCDGGKVTFLNLFFLLVSFSVCKMVLKSFAMWGLVKSGHSIFKV